ncbi:MAG: ABC transporter transmembrane domain-containing protein [Streptosporangiaceae bacterium]
MSSALERVLGAFRTVKASGAELREGARVHDAAERTWRANLRADLFQAIVGNTTELSIQFAFLAVLVVGGAQVASGAIGVGTLVAFLLYIIYMMGPLNQVANAVTQYQVGAAAADRIIVMDGGQVVATGTHAEPVAASSLYAELAATQFLSQADVPAPDAPPDGPVPEARATGLVAPKPR